MFSISPHPPRPYFDFVTFSLEMRRTCQVCLVREGYQVSEAREATLDWQWEQHIPCRQSFLKNSWRAIKLSSRERPIEGQRPVLCLCPSAAIFLLPASPSGMTNTYECWEFSSPIPGKLEVPSSVKHLLRQIDSTFNMDQPGDTN